MNKFFVSICIIALPQVLCAQVLNESLLSSIGLDVLSIESLVKPKTNKHTRFIASDPNLKKKTKTTKITTKEKAFNLLTDKGVNLDIDGNGKDDFWRLYKRGGNLSGVNIDSNEDGFNDTEIRYAKNGWIRSEKRNRNFDKAYDLLKKCKSAIDCVTLLDNDYNGFYETKVKLHREDGLELVEIVYEKKTLGSTWKEIDRRKVSYLNSSEASVNYECEGDCIDDLTNNFGSIAEIEKALSLKSPRVTAVQFTTIADGKPIVHTYDHLDDLGILVNQNCYSQPGMTSKVFIDQIRKALSTMISCASSAKGEFKDLALEAKDKKEFEKYNALAGSLQDNIGGGLLTLLSTKKIKDRPKITCTQVGTKGVGKAFILNENENRIEEEVDMSSANMVALSRGLSMELISDSGAVLEVVDSPSILITKRDALYEVPANHSAKARKNRNSSTNNFTRTIVHEFIHLIMGDSHGEHEAAYGCTSMCGELAHNGEASENGKFICATPTSGAGVSGVISKAEYLYHTSNILMDAVPNETVEGLSGVEYPKGVAEYLGQYLNRFDESLFKELSKKPEQLWMAHIAPLSYFFEDEPEYLEAALAGRLPKANKYSPNNPSEVYKFVITEILLGNSIPQTLKRVGIEAKPSKAVGISAEARSINTENDFLFQQLVNY